MRAAILGWLACMVGALVGLVACGRPEPEPARLSEGPIEWSVSARVDKREVQIGEDLTLTLALRHPPGGELVQPASSELEPFTVLETDEIETSPTETELRYRLAAYRLPEELEIPGLIVRYRDEAGELSELPTEPVPVRLVTSLTPEVTTIHDIKDPVPLEVPRDLGLLWWLLAALLAAILAYLIYRKLRRKSAEEHARTWGPPPLPPEIEAREALRRLEARNLIERGAFLPFYTELTEILKRYAGRRFEVPYLERTTHEILADLAPVTPPEALGDLRGILEESDLVKFAKWLPGGDEARSSLARARGFLERTWPVRLPEATGASGEREEVEAAV